MSRRRDKKVSVEGDNRPLVDKPFDALGGLADSLSLRSGVDEAQVIPKVDSANRSSRKKSRGRVEVRREKAGRGGKVVTTLKAFPGNLPISELEVLLSSLKKRFACGGTLRGRDIELQGDVSGDAMESLSAEGFSPVRAGG